MTIIKIQLKCPLCESPLQQYIDHHVDFIKNGLEQFEEVLNGFVCENDECIYATCKLSKREVRKVRKISNPIENKNKNIITERKVIEKEIKKDIRHKKRKRIWR